MATATPPEILEACLSAAAILPVVAAVPSRWASESKHGRVYQSETVVRGADPSGGDGFGGLSHARLSRIGQARRENLSQPRRRQLELHPCLSSHGRVVDHIEKGEFRKRAHRTWRFEVRRAARRNPIGSRAVGGSRKI